MAREKADAEKDEKERIAKENVEAERVAQEQAEAERVAQEQTEQAQIAQEAEQAQAQQVAQPEPATVQQAPVQQAAPTQPARTDGFNFKGYHYDLSSFAGDGKVPHWTPYVYQWVYDPSHYLFEKASDAGSAVWNIGIGDTVVINGQSYTVFNIIRNVPNDENAYDVLKSQGTTVTWQTCETGGNRPPLAIWYAR